MVAQRDYLHGESQLVPNSLRVYRHFFVSTFEQTAHRDWDKYGTPLKLRYEPVPPKLLSMNGRTTSYSEGGQGPFFAACKRSNTIFGTGGLSASYKIPPPEHNSPHVDCTCGFYAHYDPATDFYPDMGWSAMLGGGPTQIWDLEDMQNIVPVSYLEPYIIVRAVVEVSGTTVMGSRGVRAERMKILAMAVDWEKFVSYREAEVVDPIEITSFADREPQYFPSVRVVRRPVRGKPSDEQRAEAHTAVEAVADAAGAKFYADVDLMYREHPQPDLSGLGIEPHQPQHRYEVHDSWANAMRQASTQLLQAQQAVFDQITQDIKQTLADTTPPPKPKPKGMPDAVWQMLEKKRNKPAPPGSGIDRRKWKP